MSNRQTHRTRPPEDLQRTVARDDILELRSHRVGALPIVNRILERMRLRHFFDAYLPPQDKRTKIAPSVALAVLVRNILVSRGPMYGVGEWAAQFAPDLLDLAPDQAPALNDDRVGRCLDLVFESEYQSFSLALVSHVIEEFGVSLDQLHNDSTSIRFFGKYEEARRPRRKKGKETLAIVWGHSKDHRPDLKQLLFILTVSEDGGIPIHFRPADGNVTDDQTHCRTWDLLRELTGRSDFLYVADCKLATVENMKYIDQNHGRFVTVLPATRAEDTAFRERIAEHPLPRNEVHRKVDEETGQVLDIYSLVGKPAATPEGFRLFWYHSSRKEELDLAARAKRIDRTLHDLDALRDRLFSPRTRLKTKAAVCEAIDEILQTYQTGELLDVQVYQIEDESFRQTRPGRPGPKTEYVRKVRTRFDISYEIDIAILARERLGDGYFPLISNDLELDKRDVLLAYKKQPIIEKRFSQFKSDFHVASIYLKSVSRIEGLLCVYFVAMLAQALLEREIRTLMSDKKVPALPIYPEGRSCKAPCSRRILDLFDNIQRHVLVEKGKGTRTLLTALAPVQEQVLDLLGLRASYFK